MILNTHLLSEKYRHIYLYILFQFEFVNPTANTLVSVDRVRQYPSCPAYESRLNFTSPRGRGGGFSAGVPEK